MARQLLVTLDVGISLELLRNNLHHRVHLGVGLVPQLISDLGCLALLNEMVQPLSGPHQSLGSGPHQSLGSGPHQSLLSEQVLQSSRDTCDFAYIHYPLFQSCNCEARQASQ